MLGGFFHFLRKGHAKGGNGKSKPQLASNCISAGFVAKQGAMQRYLKSRSRDRDSFVLLFIHYLSVLRIWEFNAFFTFNFLHIIDVTNSQRDENKTKPDT